MKAGGVSICIVSSFFVFSYVHAEPQLPEELQAQLAAAKSGLKNIDGQMLHFLATAYPEEYTSFFSYWGELLQMDPKKEKIMIGSILRCLDIEETSANKTLLFLTMSEVFELGIRNRLDTKDSKELGQVLSENVLMRFEHVKEKAEAATRGVVGPEEPGVLGLTKPQKYLAGTAGSALLIFLCVVMWKAATKDGNNISVIGNSMTNTTKQTSNSTQENRQKYAEGGGGFGGWLLNMLKMVM